MKKFLALLLALAMIASLAACGSKTVAPTETTAAPSTEAPATEAPTDPADEVVYAEVARLKYVDAQIFAGKPITKIRLSEVYELK